MAVSTLAATRRDRHAALAVRLGAAWGAGHALTLVAVGVPALLFHDVVPAPIERAAEVLIGVIIVVLGFRVLRAWRRGAFHAHVHEHGAERHAHVHGHAEAPGHGHGHCGRTARQAFAIGTVHGLGGSAGVTVLLLAAIPDPRTAAFALACVAAGSAAAMALISCGLGALLGTRSGRLNPARAVPAIGVAAAAFGVWYVAAAVLG